MVDSQVLTHQFNNVFLIILFNFIGMKKTTLLFLFSLVINMANAQFKQIAEGPSFKEADNGYAQILQMKNGGTLFIVLTGKKGINVRVYDANHKEVAVNDIEPSYGELSNAHVVSVFEIKGDVVMMVTDLDKKIPVLTRLIIDGKTGDLKTEQKICELNKVRSQQEIRDYALTPIMEFFVKKDIHSDNYALVTFDLFEPDKNKRICIVLYGPDNKEVSRAYSPSPIDKYEYLRYFDMTVIDGEKVCALFYAYDKSSSFNKKGGVFLVSVDRGKSAVNFTELDFTKDNGVWNGISAYDSASKSLVLLTLFKKNGRDKYYTAQLAFIDPFQYTIKKVGTITPSKRLNQYLKKDYVGVPQDMFINNDGTVTIVCEEGEGTNDSFAWIENASVTNYSKTGEFINEYFIPKSMRFNYMAVKPLYHSGAIIHWFNNDNPSKCFAYQFFAYLNANSGNYILLNDSEKNNAKQNKISVGTYSDIGDLDGFYYPLNTTDIVPKRNYFFGEPAGKNDHYVAYFALSDYNKDNDTYATLVKEHNSKNIKLVWLKPL